MTKSEFMKLSSYEKMQLMIRATKSKPKNLELISKLKDWFEEILICKDYILVPQWGWIKGSEIREMGIDPDTGKVYVEDCIDLQGRQKHKAPKMDSFLKRRFARNAQFRDWTESTPQGYQAPKQSAKQDNFL